MPKKGKPHIRQKFNVDLTEKLISAVDEYDIDDIEKLVRAGADINARNSEGLTLVQMAIKDRTEDIAEILLSLGADVNLKAHSNGYTAMHYAADSGDEDLVALLLKHKANVNIADKRGETPLHIAAHEGHEDTVRKLLDAGAAVLAQDNLGRTPARTADIQGQHVFHFAAEAYHNITELLKTKEKAQREIQAAEALRKAQEEKVKRDLDILRHGPDPKRFKLKPPGK